MAAKTRVRNPEQGDQRFHGKATTSTDARPGPLGMAANLLLEPRAERRGDAGRESRDAQIRGVLRLHFACGLSKRRIAPLVGVGPTAVRECIGRATTAGLGWPLPEVLDDEALERCLFPPQSELPDDRPTPDWSAVAKELRHKGVTCGSCGRTTARFTPTVMAIPGSVIASGSGAAGCRRRCGSRTVRRTAVRRLCRPDRADRRRADRRGQGSADLHRRARRVELHLRLPELVAEATGLDRRPRRRLRSLRSFEAFGGVPELVVCDNLKAGVTKASRVEPTINATYREMAEHYGVAVLPTRPRKPRATRPRSRSASKSSSVGSWPGCATGPSSASTNWRRRSNR